MFGVRKEEIISKGLTKLVNENLLQELNELKAVMELGVHGKRGQKVPLLFKSNDDSCFINQVARSISLASKHLVFIFPNHQKLRH